MSFSSSFSFSFPPSFPSSFPAIPDGEFSPKEVRSATNFQKSSDVQVHFHFDPTTQNVSATIAYGEILPYTVPREAIQGISADWNFHQVYRFIQQAICTFSEDKHQLTLLEPKRFFIEKLTMQKIEELEKSMSSLDETIQAQNGPQFIYEFIQNACDAASSERELDIAFILHKDALVISHSGKHFDKADIRTICTNQNKGNRKRKEAESIGYKGVGFKSIFNHTNTVTIVSEYSFRFDKQAAEWQGKPDFPWELCPLYTLPAPLIEKYGLDPNRVNYVIQLNTSENRIAKHLEDFFTHKAPEVFFFLPRLKRLYFGKAQAPGSEMVFQKEPHVVPRGEDEPPSDEEQDDTEIETFSLIKNGEEIGSWLRYKKTLSLTAEIKNKLKTEPRIPERYKDMEETPISFILPLHEEQKRRATLYCYLPTTVSLGLPIPINAHFFLDLSRQALQKDHFFNEFLFGCIGDNLFPFYAFVARHYPKRLFSALEVPADLTFDTNPETYRASFQERADQGLRSLAFLPSQDKVLLKPQEAMIDEWGFAIHFESSTVKKRVLQVCDSQYYPILEKIGVRCYGWENIVARLKNKKFAEWIAANPQKLGLTLLRYFKALFESKKQMEEIRQLPFLLSHYPRETAELLFSPRNIHFPHHPPLQELEFVKIALLHPQLRNDLSDEETKWLKESLLVSTATWSIYVDKINQAASETLVARVLTALFSMLKLGAPLPTECQNLKLPVQLNNRKRVFAPPVQCYLPDALQPKHPLQSAIAPQYENYLSEAIYATILDDQRVDFSTFLCILGVMERITEDNIPKIVKSLATDSQKVSFIRFIYHTLFLIPDEEAVFNACAKKLGDKLILKTLGSRFKSPVDCFLPSAYHPKMDLVSASQLVRKHLSFVSEEYIQDPGSAKSWRTFFLKLGVRDHLKIQTYDSMNAFSFQEELTKEMGQIGWRNHTPSHPECNYIEFLWQKTDYPASRACIRSLHAVPFSTLGCAPTNGFRRQHTIAPVVWIEYSFLLKGTHLFWQMIRTHWDDLMRTFGESVSYRTYCSSRESGIPSMLEFYSQGAVETDSGARFSPPNIYSPTLRWLVHPILPVPKADFPLTEEQLTFFKFKTQISFPDCIILLRALQENREDPNKEEKVAAIYTHMAQTTDEWHDLPSDLLLMAEDGSFKKPGMLFGNCVEGLDFKQAASHLLKKPSSVSLEGFSSVCMRLGIQMLTKEILSVEAVEMKVEDFFKQTVIRRLPFIFDLVQSEALQELERRARQINTLRFVTAPDITLTFEREGIVFREPVFAWIHGQTLYGRENFGHLRTLSQTAHYLCVTFNLPCKTEELVHLLSASDAQISADYAYQDATEFYTAAQALAHEIEERVKIPMAVKEEKKDADAMDLDERPLPSTPPVSPIKPNPSTLKRKSSVSLSSHYPKKFAAQSSDTSKPRPVSRENYPRRAEEAVFAYFSKKYQVQEQNGEIIKRYSEGLFWDRKIIRWINYYSETYGDYDFQIDYMKGDDLKKTKYLEVKSKDPKSQHLGFITLSDEEKGRMDGARENYSIWIVKFTEEGEPLLYKISKPHQNIQDGTIQIESVSKPQHSLTIPEGSLHRK